MDPYILAIDIGTGSTKGVALSRSGLPLQATAFHYPTLHPFPRSAEQEPEAVWTAFVQTVKAITGALGRPPEAMAFSSAMHSLMITNGDGQPKTRLITWADGRAAKQAAALRGTPEGTAIYRATGTPLHPMSPLMKLRWMNEHGGIPEGSRVLSVKEYIWHRLFGTFEVDHSIASATGLLSLHTREWHPAALQACGLPASALSLPRPTGYLRTEWKKEAMEALGLPKPIPVCIGASDGCLAPLGSGATGAAQAALTIGTSGAVRRLSRTPWLDDAAMPFTYLLDDEHYVCGAPVNNGGNVLPWLAQQVFGKESNDYTALFTLAAGTPAGAEGLLFLPYLYGERAPVWDAQASGAWVGLTARHGAGHLIRSALEGVCLSLAALTEDLQKGTGPIDLIGVSGGFTRSRFWMQLLADITGKVLRLQDAEDASAIGAALLGWKALGTEVQSEPGGEITMEPVAAHHDRYRELLPLFRQIYPALRHTAHRLHQMNPTA